MTISDPAITFALLHAPLILVQSVSASETNPERLQSAIKQQVGRRQVTGYREIAKDFIENLDTINPDAIVAAVSNEKDVRVERKDNGKIVIHKGNRSYGWREAIRNKIVAVS